MEDQQGLQLLLSELDHILDVERRQTGKELVVEIVLALVEELLAVHVSQLHQFDVLFISEASLAFVVIIALILKLL